MFSLSTPSSPAAAIIIIPGGGSTRSPPASHAYTTSGTTVVVVVGVVSMPFGAIHPHHTPHVYGGAHFAAPHGRDAPHAADHRRRRLRERKVWRSRTPKYPSADRQRARGRRCERNRDVCRHAPVATDTSGRVCDWRARRRREAVPEGTVAVRVSTHDTSIAQRFACKNSFFSVFSNCLPVVKLASDAPTGSPKKNVRLCEEKSLFAIQISQERSGARYFAAFSVAVLS